VKEHQIRPRHIQFVHALVAIFVLGLTIDPMVELFGKITMRMWSNLPADNGQLGGFIDRVIEALQRTSQAGVIWLFTEECLTLLYSLICFASIVLLTRPLPPKVYMRIRKFIHE
jgi:hypothetical protein